MIEHDGAPTVGARDITFENRIAITAVATAAVVLTLACGLFIFEQWRAERSDVGHAVVALTRVIGVGVAPAVERGDHAAAQAALNGLSAAPAVRHAEVFGPDKALFAHYPVGTRVAPASAGELVTRQPLSFAGRPVGELALTVRPPNFRLILPRYLAVCGALFFAAVAIALFMGRWLARQVIQPVNRLSQVMRDVTDSGDYSERLPLWAGDEFGHLTESFNSLLAQLQANDSALHRAMSDLVEARDAAQAANVLKSQFLANMSHEIRTPLNGVLAMAQIMALGELAPNQRSRVEVIRRSGEDLLAVLNDILDLSKIEAGKMEIEEGELDAERLAARLAEIHATAAAEKKTVGFKVDARPGAAGPRRGDPARLTQVLNNLISNAFKFTAEGQVEVVIDGYGAEGRDGLRIEVRDTGMGIAADKLPLLFQKFSQADGSNTRRFGGAGLGLALCRELVRLMRGRIEVASLEGQGSTFTVHLPMARTDAVPTAAGGLGADRPLRVLAAEDIPTNQLVLRTILQSFGVELRMTANGQEAVEAWRAGAYDLILMDIQMPVLDGVDATRAIRAEEAATGRPRTPIIAVSANAMPHHVKTYMAAGMDGHVAKPIELAKLTAAITEVVGGWSQSAVA